MGFRSNSLVTIVKSLSPGTPGGRSDSADASRPSPSSSVSGLSLSCGSNFSSFLANVRSATSSPSEEPDLYLIGGFSASFNPYPGAALPTNTSLLFLFVSSAALESSFLLSTLKLSGYATCSDQGILTLLSERFSCMSSVSLSRNVNTIRRSINSCSTRRPKGAFS